MSKLTKGQQTKEAILHSALAGFCQHGFDGIGVREIAETVGVTAMMINRYFGSKEELFAEVCDLAFSQKGILTEEVMLHASDPEKFCKVLLTNLLQQTSSEGEILSGFPLLLRSVGNEKAEKILKQKIEVHFEEPLAKVLKGSKRSERAAIFLAFISGVQLFRQILDNKSLNETSVATLTKMLLPLFEAKA